ncbi:hypothetical protein PM082_016692 [Marasmius tenuissimus]|nr:hypothetical protein PM082_016692 [Marasmius tenuissimus]
MFHLKFVKCVRISEKNLHLDAHIQNMALNRPIIGLALMAAYRSWPWQARNVAGYGFSSCKRKTQDEVRVPDRLWGHLGILRLELNYLDNMGIRTYQIGVLGRKFVERITAMMKHHLVVHLLSNLLANCKTASVLRESAEPDESSVEWYYSVVLIAVVPRCLQVWHTFLGLSARHAESFGPTPCFAAGKSILNQTTHRRIPQTWDFKLRKFSSKNRNLKKRSILTSDCWTSVPPPDIAAE